MKEHTTIRLFTGISLPAALREEMQDFSRPLSGRPGIRVTSPENLHITTYFLGSTPEEQLPNIMAILQLESQKTAPFELFFKSLTLAPSKKPPRMLWAEYEKAPAFLEMVHRLHAYFSQIQKPKQTRRSPKPHITLARFKPGRDLSGLNLACKPETSILKVNELLLWSSETQPEGPIYRSLASFPLSGEKS